MRRFWQGMLWGSVIGGLLGVTAMSRPQKKPLMSFGSHMIKDKTEDLFRQAGRARRRMTKKIF